MTRKMGASSKVEKWQTPKGLEQVEEWARQGLSNNQIAHNMGVSRSAFYELQRNDTNFMDSIKRGKEVIDLEVENALLKRALGYEFEEVETIVEKDDAGRDRKRIKKTIKHIPSSDASMIFWLKNRRPAEWRDKQDIEHTGQIGTVIINDIPRQD